MQFCGVEGPVLLVGLRTVRITGTAVMNMVQTGDFQAKRGLEFTWAIPNGSGQV